MFGEPENADYSPQDEESRFGHYTWAAHGFAILTWLVDDDEFIWGVRVDQAGPADPALGFAVGSTRQDVLTRFPDGWSKSGDVLQLVYEDGSLTIKFDDDRVSCIELMAPMGGK
jgi:hypothetical protein